MTGLIRNEQLRYYINREFAKILALSSDKIDKYLSGKEILPPDQSRMINKLGLLILL